MEPENGTVVTGGQEGKREGEGGKGWSLCPKEYDHAFVVTSEKSLLGAGDTGQQSRVLACSFKGP